MDLTVFLKLNCVGNKAKTAVNTYYFSSCKTGAIMVKAINK